MENNELIDPWAGDPTYPRRPAGLPLPPVGDAARAKRWGRFRWRPDGESRIRILGDWRRENIARVRHPVLTRLGRASGVDVHCVVEESFLALLTRWETECLAELLLTWNGSYVPRRTRGRQSLSSHSWGTAFDVNAKWNPLGKRPALIGEEGQVRDLVASAAELGWFWGGWFSRPDGMHFEAV
jgi:hypothetical protein